MGYQQPHLGGIIIDAFVRDVMSSGRLGDHEQLCIDTFNI
jgi:hypothetical protein